MTTLTLMTTLTPRIMNKKLMTALILLMPPQTILVTTKRKRSRRQKRRSFRSDKYVILAKAYMQHSEDTMSGTDQKGSTFWKKVMTTYNKFVSQTNKINKNIETFIPIDE